MKIEKVTVGRSFNIGNYESVRFELTAELEGENPEQVVNIIGAELENLKNLYLDKYRCKKGK